ncbi:MAG TPA: hypothetical protein VHO69_14935 [Phototrophicaceae bacterium]|nr:hypothetical protein [Phototrophicaceae bacterium]
MNGRLPSTFSEQNVIETIQLTATAASLQNRDWLLSELQRYRRAAQDFWVTEGQTAPVWLRWKAAGAPGPQFARIYSMDIAGGNERFQGAQTMIITVTIEREPYWQAEVPPGGSPKIWTCFVNGVELSTANASLYDGTDHIAYGTVANKQEFDTIYTFLTQNFLDIPANKIPGDAPALVTISATKTGGSYANYTHDMYVAKSTNRPSMTDRAGNALPLYNVFPASGGSGYGVLTTDTSRGVVHNPVSPLARTVIYTPADALENLVRYWSASATGMPHLNPAILRGTYMIFVRAVQNGGAAKNTKLRLTMESSAGVFFDSGQVYEQLSVTGSSALHYMGTVTLPVDDHSAVGMRGQGISVEYDFNMKLYVQRTTGTSTSEIIDVMLLKIDEGCVQVVSELYMWAPTYECYDNTGYLAHGKPEAVGTIRYLPAASDAEYTPLASLQGGDLMLTPGVNNRLYFLWAYRGTDPTTSPANQTFNVCVNIVPRWVGVRDV